MTSVLDRLTASLADRYALEREIGRGGMATVYLAQDLKHDRTVAIKVLQPELSATIGTDRFDREIRVAAKLQHPHILTLYDSGDADGLLYYVMPFVSGESLRDRMDREKLLPIDDAIQITLEVADALGYAHSHGVIHRDIKPENILLTGGHALVADFGIARAVSSAGSDQKLTETGMALGTPIYMSPEQAVGDEVGPTSDLYSLGCVLYEMLAGTPPFTGPNSRAIMARHAMDPVPGLQVIRDTVPDEIEDAVFFALAKVPADRPQTAAQFAEALGTPLGMTASRRSGSASRVTMSRRTARTGTFVVEPAKRRKPWVWAAVGVFITGVTAFAGWRFLEKDPPAADVGLDRHNIAVLYFEDRSPQGNLGYLADGLTEGLITSLGGVRTLSVISRNGVAQYRGSTVGPDSIARALQVGTIVTGTVEPADDSVRVSVRVFDDAGNEFGRTTFKEDAKNLAGLTASLAQQAAEQIRKRIGEEVQVTQSRAATENTEAWALYQRAEGARRRGDSVAQAGDVGPSFVRQFQTADSLAAMAEARDPKWIDPIVLRATLAYWRSRHAGDDIALTSGMIDSGLAHANRALALDRNHPAALEMRGSINYWKWLNGLEPDSSRAAQLLLSAQTDLETVTRNSPAQSAGAWAMLSHMYANLPDKSMVDVILAATKAMETDAYLSNADVVLSRLALANYDEGTFAASERWCSEGRRRFPEDWHFLECELFLMTSPFKAPDPARAWLLADTMVQLTQAGSLRRYQELNSQVLVAGVLARAGQIDSAKRMLSRAKDDPVADQSRDLANTSAYMWLLAKDTTAAVNRIKDYLAVNPGRRAAFAESPNWWFRGIQNDPRYRAAVGGR
jgi:TolB-like protein/tRNA A-37 threonylcarbamoyl transferase component Bud32